MIASSSNQQRPGAVLVLEEVIAWRAALSGWGWVCLCIAGGMVRGLAIGQLASKDGSFVFFVLAWGIAMTLLLFGVWRRLCTVSRLGFLSFTVVRLGWLIVFTVLGATLSAVPSGAFQVIIDTLRALPSLPASDSMLVMNRLVLGQGWVVLAVIPWLSYIIMSFTKLHVRAPLVLATLITLVVLFMGAALGLLSEALGILFVLATLD